MSARSYKMILLLLSGCVFGILALQAYWIRNTYLQKKEAFDRAVYASLEQFIEKLQERKKLQALKTTYIIQDGDTILKAPLRRLELMPDKQVEVLSRRGKAKTRKILALKASRKPFDTVSAMGKDVKVRVNGGIAQVTVLNKDITKVQRGILEETEDLETETEEMTRLVDKMIMEIKVMDTETEHPDTLRSLIGRTLENKGLFLPFEFSVQKLPANPKQTKLRSKGFDEKAFAYRSDLSANKIIASNDYIFLQFPGQSDFVLGGMKGSLLLSFFFSLLIIGVFYYVMRLIYSQKKLSEIRNDFVNNMTHELRTPIATMSLALDAIANPLVKKDEEKFAEYNRILKEENQKLNHHVERVLQIALLDKGKLPLVKAPVEISELILKAIDSFRLQIREQKAEVVFSPPGQKILYTGDAYHLQTVFCNLLDNALKYSPGKGRIHIAVTKRANCIRLVFKDNGIGIAPSQQEKIFDTFYRVQGGNLHDVKGFGLGLSYVRSIVEAHGGSIEVKSELGKGAEFVIGIYDK